MFPEMLTGVPNGTSAVLDLTAEFAPLLIGLYGLLVVSIGGLVLSSLSSLTERTARPMDTKAVRPAAEPEVSEAA
jgi:hypothetical protein